MKISGLIWLAEIVDKLDYSFRATKMTDDEIGVVIDAFNNMLDQVQSQDNQIRTTSQQLQTTTEQLRRTHARLRSALITGSRRRSYGRPRSISSYLMQAVRSTPSTARARRPSPSGPPPARKSVATAAA